MIVVADTSPLNYLVLIDAVDLLPDLFGTVLIPEAAFKELKHPQTPAKVRDWILSPPIMVRSSWCCAHFQFGTREA